MVKRSSNVCPTGWKTRFKRVSRQGDTIKANCEKKVLIFKRPTVSVEVELNKDIKSYSIDNVFVKTKGKRKVDCIEFKSFNNEASLKKSVKKIGKEQVLKCLRK